MLLFASSSMSLAACEGSASRAAPIPPSAASSSASSTKNARAEREPASLVASAAPSNAVPRPTPLAADADVVALSVPGFADAALAVPRGATDKRPIVVSVHGNFDVPEVHCRLFRQVLGSAPFILAPRGVARTDSPPGDTRFTFANGDAVAREIDADLAALRAKYGAWIDDGPIVYMGFSLGAITGVRYVLRDPARTPRVVLIEGGHDAWTPFAAKQFVSSGGARVLFACGQAGCKGAAEAAAKRIEAAGGHARVVRGEGEGHTYGGRVADAIADALPWLLAGDPRFATR